MMRNLVLLVFGFCLAACGAQKYALLIGNGKYLAGQGLPNLEGPDNDVSAMAALLGKEYGFPAQNVTIVRNGSRAEILAAFDRLIERVHPGDFVLFYYSGHGTSPQDPAWRQPLPIDGDAGALIPSDFRRGTPAEVTERLVVGRRDLRPRLAKLDGKAVVFGLLDTCFSQNLMKDVMAVYRGQPRSVSARDLTLRGQGIEEDFANDLKDIAQQSKPGPYPYKTVAWISAAQAGEQAVDLDSGILRANPNATFDKLAHGQFTNAVVIGLHGAADLNHDGAISNSELYDYLVKTADKDHWSHQPALSMNEDDVSFSKSAALGGRSLPIAAGPEARPEGKVRVKLENSGELSGAVASAEIETGERDPDLIVRRDGGGYWIYEASGIPVIEAAVSPEQAVARVKAEPALRALRNWSYAGQTTNAAMSLWKDGDRLHQGLFVSGNVFDVHAHTDAAVWLLAIDIDKDGYITVLYPRKDQANRQLNGDENLGLNGVKCPCGIEYLKAFLFDRKPAGFEEWAGKEFEPSSGDMKKLLDVVRSGVGETTLRIVTNSR